MNSKELFELQVRPWLKDVNAWHPVSREERLLQHVFQSLSIYALDIFTRKLEDREYEALKFLLEHIHDEMLRFRKDSNYENEKNK